MCPTDRIPGETSFTELLVSQPANQQGFTFGNTPLPKTAGGEIIQASKVWNLERKDDEPLPVFDWKNRTLILAEFSKQCINSLKQPAYFEWDKAQGMPSSILNPYLASEAFRLGIDSAQDDELQKVLADPNRTPWMTKDGARQIYVPSVVLAPASTTAKTAAASVSPQTTAKNLQHVELPVDHRISATGGTQNKYAEYLRPTIDCFPLHLSQSNQLLLQPYIDAPMDVVLTAIGRTETNFMPFNVVMIEWLIPLSDLLQLFTIGGTIDHPDLPAVDPIKIGRR
ncbi:hypothetical protein LZ32DRAFT_663606 [Colletotrichum eremochloae]|nr:hypothetical protein LZ32DRAFT_663606 [Colletotrichum eremochloae]